MWITRRRFGNRRYSRFGNLRYKTSDGQLPALIANWRGKRGLFLHELHELTRIVLLMKRDLKFEIEDFKKAVEPQI
jgi:hypothetical protein